MRNGLFTPIRKLLANKRKHKLWLRVVSLMMAVVVFCTTYALILPAITLEKQKTYCGLEEHTHTDECYVSSSELNNRTLTCDPTADADFVIHSHNEYCYNGEGELICTLPELAEHIHNDDCYTVTKELTCGLEESEGHTHSDACYEKVQGEMICTDTSAEHTHTEDCYEWSDELTCGLEESEGHTHDDNCYTENRELTCTEVEVELHTHNDSCRDGDGVLFCGKPQIIEHEHTEDCLSKVKGGAGVITTAVTENTEATADSSSDDKVLICGQQEHKHTDECYIDSNKNSGEGGAGSTEKQTAKDESTTEATTVEGSTETTTAAVEESEDNELSFPYADDLITGIVTIPYSESLPKDLDCTIIPITDNEENYEDLNKTVDMSLTSGVQKIETAQLYRLEWTSGGEIYDLPSGIVPKVNVSVLERGGNESVKGLVISEKFTNEEKQELKTELGLDNPIELYNAMPLAAAAGAESLEEISESVEEITVTAEENSDEADSEDEDSTEEEYLTPYAVKNVSAELDGTSLELKLSSMATFAVAKVVYASNNSTNAYYKRVDSLDEITDDGEYLVVCANFMVAVTGTLSPYTYFPVEARPVAQNPEYFEIIDVSSDSRTYVNTGDYISSHWNFLHNTSDGYYYMRKADSNSTTVTDSTAYIRFGGYSATGFTFEQYADGQDGWNIVYNKDGGWRSIQSVESYTGSDVPKVSCATSKSAYNSNPHNFKVIIFKYVGNATDEMNEVIDDEERAEGITDGEEEIERWTKPTYEKAKSVSGARSGSEVLGASSKLEGATMEYASDPSSSAIEKFFGGLGTVSNLEAQYKAQTNNDGRVLLDKSVIHGKDDYGALNSSDFDTDDFSITMSALGQEWRVRDTATIPTALDVVFVMDLSNSMFEKTVKLYTSSSSSSSSTSTLDELLKQAESATGESTEVQRWIEAADAVNNAMKNIMYGDSTEEADERQYNRVGLVTYSDSAYSMLPLDRYTATDDAYITYDPTDHFSLGLASDVTGEENGAPEAQGKSFNDYTGMWDATYTQRGIEKAYDVLNSSSDKSFNVTLSNGVEATVKRKPVIILLTDGDPTLCSYNYMDPMSGPNYGVGESYGIIGYYTILTANYFKNMTSISYGRKASFYTVGMGIKESGHGTLYESASEFSVTADNAYMRAVLDPTAENIAALDYDSTFWADNDDGSDLIKNSQIAATKTWVRTNQKLKALLTGKMETAAGSLEYEDFDPSTFTENVNNTESYLSTGEWSYTSTEVHKQDPLGYTNARVRGMVLPYKNYSFCDGAYFGDLTEEDLDGIFDDIINLVEASNDYNFLFESHSNVNMIDYIGSGMEVKGEPVLRYFGVNYGAEHRKCKEGAYFYIGSEKYEGKMYTWDVTVERQANDVKEKDEQTLDLSGIKMYICTSTSDNTSQAIWLIIPESLFPTYYPDLTKYFYFEELPIRVIYRVGLSEAEETKLAAHKAIKNAVYYTNKYNASSNTYYGASFGYYKTVSGNPWETTLYAKGKNWGYFKAANTTSSTVYSRTESQMTSGYIYQKFGNNGKLVINREPVQDIEVTKKWADEHDGVDSVTVNLYGKGTAVNGDTTTEGIWLIDTVELNEANNWTYKWEDLPLTETDGDTEYTYDNLYIAEAAMDSFAPKYADSSGNELSTDALTINSAVDESDADSEEESEEGNNVAEEVNAVIADGGSVVITNNKTYTLPESGGIGTHVFTLSAVLLLTAAGFMYIYSKRKDKRIRQEAM